METCECCGGTGVEVEVIEDYIEEVGLVIVDRTQRVCGECGGTGAVEVEDHWVPIAEWFARKDEHEALAFHKAW